MSFDIRILEAIKGATRGKPKDLAGILAYVDSRERVVLTHQEMEGGLRRLVESECVAEASDHRFYEISAEVERRAFSGLTPEDYQQACEEYRQRFWETHAKRRIK